MAKVSNERAEGHYWTVFGSSAKWDVMYWRDGYFWDSADCGYTEDKFTVGPQILPPGDTQSLRNAQSEAVAYWAVHSQTGSHIGLWEDETYARNVLKEYAGGTITPLYTHPAPQSEAVAWGKPAHPSAVEPFFIFDTDRVHDWQKAVFTVPLYTHPAPPLAVTDELPQDVIDLVIAARIVAFEDQSPEALKALDTASEAFASRVGWDDEPEDVTAALEAKQ